jgi:hypothetical protein
MAMITLGLGSHALLVPGWPAPFGLGWLTPALIIDLVFLAVAIRRPSVARTLAGVVLGGLGLYGLWRTLLVLAGNTMMVTYGVLPAAAGPWVRFLILPQAVAFLTVSLWLTRGTAAVRRVLRLTGRLAHGKYGWGFLLIPRPWRRSGCSA